MCAGHCTDRAHRWERFWVSAIHKLRVVFLWNRHVAKSASNHYVSEAIPKHKQVEGLIFRYACLLGGLGALTVHSSGAMEPA